MKRNIKFIIVTGLALLLAFPFGTGVFAREKQNIEPIPAPALMDKAPQVTVVPAQVSAGIGISPAPVGCKAENIAAKLTFAQDPAVIDLNQPANCFALKTGQVIAQGNLEVKPLLAVLPDIRVNKPAARIAALRILPENPLPHPVVLAAMVADFHERKFKREPGASFMTGDLASNGFSFLLTLAQLKNRRC